MIWQRHHLILLLLLLLPLFSSVCVGVAQTDEDNDEAGESPPSAVALKSLIGKNKMKLQWDIPSPKPDYFLVQYNNESVQVQQSAILLTNLQPATNYTVTVLACANSSCISLVGPAIYRTKMGIPGLVENFDVSQVNTSHIALSWEAPSVAAGPHQFFKIRIVDRDHISDVNTTQTSIHLARPACKNGFLSTYQKVFVRGVSVDNGTGSSVVEHYGNISSPVILYVDCLHEFTKDLTDELFKLDKMSISKTWIKLWWSPPKLLKKISYYRVTYNEESILVTNTTVLLTNLKSNTIYNVSVSACSDDGDCSMSIIPLSIRTKLGIPDKVENLQVRRVSPVSLSISWSPPIMNYGQRLFYKVRINSSLNGLTNFDTEKSDTLLFVPECEEEKSNFNYTIMVAAVNLDDGVHELVGEWTNATIFVACKGYNVSSSLVPYIKHVSIGMTSISMNWTLPASPDGESYYKLHIQNSSVHQINPNLFMFNYSPNNSYHIHLLKCKNNCTSLFGPTTLYARPAFLIGVRHLTIIDTNSTHIRVQWQPPSENPWNITYTYRVILHNNRFTQKFLTDQTYVTVSKQVCDSHYALLNARICVEDIVHTAHEIEPIMVTVSAPCMKLESAFTKVELINTSIALEWTPVESGFSNQLYKVTYNEKSVDAENHFYMLTNLKPSTEYIIQVSVCGNSHCIVLTKPLKVCTNAMVMVTVENLTMKRVNSTHALILWNLSHTIDSNIRYYIELKDSNSTISTFDTNSISTIIALPNCSQVYSDNFFIEVSVVKTKQILSNIIFQSATLPVFIQCEKIKEVSPADPFVHLKKVIASTTTIELEWTDTHRTGYLVLCDKHRTYVSTSKALITGVNSSQEYTLQIFRCKDTICNLTIVPPFTIQTPRELYRVQNVTFANVNNTAVKISWQAPDYSQWLYQVKVNTSEKSFAMWTSELFLVVLLHDPVENIDVDVAITPYHAKNKDIIGSVTTGSVRLYFPSKVSPGLVAASPHQIIFSWNDSLVTGNDTSYLIRLNGSDYTWVNESKTSATLSGLTPDTTYSLEVLRCADHSCGLLVDSLVLHTQADIQPLRSVVENLTIDKKNTSHIYVQWTMPHAITPTIGHSQVSSNLAYWVQVETAEGEIVHIVETNRTHLYLPISACQSNFSSELYNISVGVRGQPLAASTSILTECRSPPVIESYAQCPTSHASVRIIFLVAVAGFMLGVTVSFYSCRNFTYMYKLR